MWPLVVVDSWGSLPQSFGFGTQGFGVSPRECIDWGDLVPECSQPRVFSTSGVLMSTNKASPGEAPLPASRPPTRQGAVGSRVGRVNRLGQARSL